MARTMICKTFSHSVQSFGVLTVAGLSVLGSTMTVREQNAIVVSR